MFVVTVVIVAVFAFTIFAVAIVFAIGNVRYENRVYFVYVAIKFICKFFYFSFFDEFLP